MIDIGISKLMLIGVVALVVIGPEKLPRVARMLGTMLGRAQRYVNDVKSEVSQQMDLEELRRMKTTVEEAARDVEQAARDMEGQVAKNIHETQSVAHSVLMGKDDVSTPATAPVMDLSAPASDFASPVHVPVGPANTHDRKPSRTVVDAPAVVSVRLGARRHKWRAQRAAVPLWYKKRQRGRSALRSGAALKSRTTHS